MLQIRFIQSMVLTLISLLILHSLSNGQFSNQLVFQNQYDQGDPFIAVHPTNSSFQVVTYYTTGATSIYHTWPGYSITTNGGATWSSGTRTITANWDGVDPTCVINASGRIIYSYAVRNFSTNRIDVIASYSDNNGATWTDWNFTSTDNTYIVHDRPFVAIDNTGGARNGWLYETWIAGTYTAGPPEQWFATSKVMFSYSTNSGLSWSAPIELDQNTASGVNVDVTLSSHHVGSTSGAGNVTWLEAPMPAVGQNGNVYVVWGYYRGGQVYNGSQWRMKVSTNGTSFGSLITTMPEFTQNAQWSCNYYVGEVINIPWIVADPGSQSVYLVYEDAKNLYDFAANVLFTKSPDAGTSWSTPVVVGNTIGTSEEKREFWPCLASNASGVVTMSFVHQDDYCVPLDVYSIHSTNGGDTWNTPVRVTSVGSQPQNYYWTTEFMGLAASAGQTFLVWNDWRNGLGSDIYRSTFSKNPASPWSGNIYLLGSLTFSAMTINAGTIVQVDAAGGVGKLTVTGGLNAVGTWDNQINFLDAANPIVPGDWNYLKLTGGPNTLKYCNFSGGVYGVFVNNTSANTIENCTFHNSRDYGIAANNTGLTANSVLIKNCVITNDNGSGISSQNGRIDLNNTSIQGNPGFGVAYWSGGKTYMQNSTVAGNSQMGLWLNSSTAYANLTPDGISPGYNAVQNNTHNQINIFTGGAFLGDTYQGNPRGGQNTVQGNCALIYNGTSTTVAAQYTRWNSCPQDPACFGGPVDASNCLASGMEPKNVPILVEASGSGGGIDELIRSLQERITTADRDKARDALAQLEGFVGPGAAHETSLGISWENFLQDLQSSTTLDGGVRSLASAYLIQNKMSQMEFDAAIDLANRIIATDPDDELWFHCQSEIVYALASKGDFTNAEKKFSDIWGRALSVNPSAAMHLRSVVDVFKADSPSAGTFANPIHATTESNVPTTFLLQQNYPNPFNPTTSIKYEIPEKSLVLIEVFDVLGRERAKLVNEYKNPGSYEVSLDASKYPSGIYFYRLQAGTFSDVKKMVLLK